VSPAAANQVAADFAARVAATLNTPSESGTKHSTIAVVTAPAVENTPNVQAMVDDGSSLEPVTQGGVVCQQGTPAHTPVNSITSAATREDSESGNLPLSTIEVIESSSSAMPLTIPPTSAAIASSADDSVVSAAEVQLSHTSLPASDVSDSKSVDVVLPVSTELPTELAVETDGQSVILSGGSVEITQLSCAEAQPKNGSSSDFSCTEVLQAPASDVEVSKKEEPVPGKLIYFLFNQKFRNYYACSSF